jgi:hypothetical protein
VIGNKSAGTKMKKVKTPKLPPIEVEEKPEKLSLSLPTELKRAMEQFSAFFAETTGQVPTSFNAVIVGILAGYLQDHGGYQKWLKCGARSGHLADGNAPT